MVALATAHCRHLFFLLSGSVLQCYNKIDQISLEEVDRLAREPHSVVTSCEMGLNLDYLLENVWQYLSLLRVFTKKRGREEGRGGGGEGRVSLVRLSFEMGRWEGVVGINGGREGRMGLQMGSGEGGS